MISCTAAGRKAGPREGGRDFGSVVAGGAAGRDAVLNEGGRGDGSVVAVGAAETVCVLHAGVPGCVIGFSLFRRVLFLRTTCWCARVRHRILTLPESTGKKRLKRIEPLLLVFWIVLLSLFFLFFQCGYSWAFRRAARPYCEKTNIHFCVSIQLRK